MTHIVHAKEAPCGADKRGAMLFRADDWAAVTCKRCLEHKPRMSDEDFVATVRNAVRWHGVRGVAELVRVSLPTVERWAEGRNLPRYGVRDAVVRATIISPPARDC